MFEFINKLKGFSLNLLFPKHCLKCGIEGTHLCQTCFEELASKTEIQKCAVCSLRNFSGIICPGACQAKTPLKRFIYAFDYKNPAVREIIHTCKYGFIEELTLPLADFLLETVKINGIKIPKTAIMVPVPLHPAKLRRRGFNQSALMALAMAKKLGIKAVLHDLSRRKNTEPQVGFPDFKDRRRNVSGAFIAKNPREFAGKRIILIDDVSTSRSTLDEAACALYETGAKSVWGMVIAKG